MMTELICKELSFVIIGAAMEVHKVLGSSFLEAVYQKVLAHELKLRGIIFYEQVRLPITYKGESMGEYVADFIVESKIILEIKAVSKLNSSHHAQAMHYLTATGNKLVLLLNFGVLSLEYRRVIK